ncbi:MAG TPA: hypothetical protein EYN52_07495 [Alphaproteobacteria bacterium]|nr:hypothetical protein [Alphaproteobacteria bacterium]
MRLDPALVKGPDACGECHKSSVGVWKDTHHATTFKSLPRSDKAKEIAKAMGIRRIKAESDCLGCHFTSAAVDGDAKPIAGITCESCHGAGKNWIDVHSDFGGKGVTADTEDPAHKTARYEQSEAAGLIRPSRIYAVAENCYTCHTVPNEKLVNVGGHPAGSKFELVAWSHGEVRHNVWYSKENNASPLERQRMMYIVGQALDLEYALRGVAKATEKAKYAVAMAKRAKRAEKRLQKIAEMVDAPEIQAILAIAAEAKLKLNNEEQLTTAANGVSVEAKKLSDSYDGSQFAGIDAVLPKLDK